MAADDELLLTELDLLLEELVTELATLEAELLEPLQVVVPGFESTASPVFFTRKL